MAQAVLPPRLISLLSSWGAGQEAVVEAATDVVDRYREPHRRYHTLEHIEEMLEVADRLAASGEVTCAVWLHDVIYDPMRPDNEERSAAFARKLLPGLGAPPTVVAEVVRLVETTAGHEPEDGDDNGQVLADADLAILGTPTDRYQRYRRDVRAEYAHLSDDDWRRGRGAVVRSFLERDALYHATQLRDERELRARENLRAELAALSTP